MKLIIDISEDTKNRLCFGITYQKDIQTICEALNNGTPLDKIGAEIEFIPTIEWKDNGTTYILASYFKKQVLEIINKYIK